MVKRLELSVDKKARLAEFSEVALRTLSPILIDMASTDFELQRIAYFCSQNDPLLLNDAETKLKASAEVYINVIDRYIKYQPNQDYQISRKDEVESVLKKLAERCN